MHSGENYLLYRCQLLLQLRRDKSHFVYITVSHIPRHERVYNDSVRFLRR